MIDCDRDSFSTGLRDEFGGFVDRLRTIHFRSFLFSAASGAIDRGAGCAEFDGDTATGPASRAGNESDFSCEIHHESSVKTAQPFYLRKSSAFPTTSTRPNAATRLQTGGAAANVFTTKRISIAFPRMDGQSPSESLSMKSNPLPSSPSARLHVRCRRLPSGRGPDRRENKL